MNDVRGGLVGLLCGEEVNEMNGCAGGGFKLFPPIFASNPVPSATRKYRAAELKSKLPCMYGPCAWG
jgi:hypothetical protein